MLIGAGLHGRGHDPAVYLAIFGLTALVALAGSVAAPRAARSGTQAAARSG